MSTNDQSHNELMVSWLNEAYAMEKGLIPALENHAKNAKESPELSQKYQQCLEDTNRHAELLRKCVEHLGGKVSTIKGGIGTVLGKLKNLTMGEGHDEVLKDALTAIGTANFASACYQAILAAAEHNGDEEIAETCRNVMLDEEDLARWLSDRVPMLAHEALHHKVRHGR